MRHDDVARVIDRGLEAVRRPREHVPARLVLLLRGSRDRVSSPKRCQTPAGSRPSRRADHRSVSAAPTRSSPIPSDSWPRDRDPLHPEPAMAVDDGREGELRGDQDCSRRDDADPRSRDRDREDDESAHHAAEQHPLRRAEGVAHAGQRPAGDEQHGERDDRADQRGRRDRLQAPDAVAEPSLHGDLHRPAEAGGEREQGGEGGRAHDPDAIRSPRPLRRESRWSARSSSTSPSPIPSATSSTSTSSRPRCRCTAFRHGKIFGSPFGEPKYR